MHSALYLPKPSAQLLPPYLNPDANGIFWIMCLDLALIAESKPKSKLGTSVPKTGWLTSLLEQLNFDICTKCCAVPTYHRFHSFRHLDTSKAGVGPMTVAMLLKNTITLAERSVERV